MKKELNNPSSLQEASLTLRPATADDAGFIAEVVAVALGADLWNDSGTHSLPDEALREVCRRSDTLYSWQHSLIAEINGEPAGGIVAYDGHDYPALRQRTFAALQHLITFDTSQMEDEAKEGEYYIDSVAVKPEYRGCGIAGKLLRAAINEGHAGGLTIVLACDPQNLRARSLYERIGFSVDGSLFIFGHDFHRMTC